MPHSDVAEAVGAESEWDELHVTVCVGVWVMDEEGECVVVAEVVKLTVGVAVCGDVLVGDSVAEAIADDVGVEAGVAVMRKVDVTVAAADMVLSEVGVAVADWVAMSVAVPDSGSVAVTVSVLGLRSCVILRSEHTAPDQPSKQSHLQEG